MNIIVNKARQRRLATTKPWMIAALLVLAAAHPAFAVQYVDNNPAVPGPRDGTGWANAFVNIQTAVNAAAPGEEIWVAGGIYREGQFAPGGDAVNGSLVLDGGTVLLGGFTGFGVFADGDYNETSNEQRDGLRNVTTIDGANTRTGGAAAYSVVTLTGDNVTIDGFSIVNGNANNSFTNTPSQNPGQEYRGGGMFIDGRNAVTVRHCRFSGNNAVIAGGALSIVNCNGSGSDAVLVQQCIFTSNTCQVAGAQEDRGLGGAIVIQRSQPVIDGCVFNNNSGRYGSGIYATWGKAGPGDGGASLLPVIQNNLFWGNTAIESGTVYNHNCASQITHNTIVNNLLGGSPTEVPADERSAGIASSNATVLPRPGDPLATPAGPATPELQNNIVFQNVVDTGAPQIVARLFGHGVNYGTNLGSNATAGISFVNAGARNYLPSTGALNVASVLPLTPALDGFDVTRPNAGTANDRGAYERDTTAPVLSVTNINATISVGNQVAVHVLDANPVVTDSDASLVYSFSPISYDDASAAWSADGTGTDHGTLVPFLNFTCFDLGANNVTLYAIDSNGNASSAPLTVTVSENIQPSVTTQDITVTLNASGNATITPLSVVAASSDNCGTVNFPNVSPSFFECEDIGPNVVTLAYNDGNGNANTTTATVTVVDATPPQVTVLDATLSLDAFGSLVVGVGDFVVNTELDNCGSVFYLGVAPNVFNCSDVGPNVVSISYNDGNGNGGSTNATLTILDGQAPVITDVEGPVTRVCPAPYTEAEARAAVDIDDECATLDGGDLTINVTDIASQPVSFPITGSGVYALTYTVSDGDNTSLPLVRTVTITDNTIPVITLNGAATIVLNIGDTFTDPGATASDSCDGSVPVVAGGDTVNTGAVGDYVITYNAQDNAGNAAVQVTRTVRVVSTGGPPIIADQPDDQSVPYDDTAIFEVLASGAGTLNYQWRKNGTPISDGAKYTGTQSSSLSVLNCENADEGNFSVVVSNVEGSVTSDNAALTVADPAIVDQPDDVSAGIGGTATFNVTAVGSGTLLYQWFRAPATPLSNQPGKITGVDTPQLQILDTQEADEANFYVVVTGADGDVQSVNARLTVSDPVIITNPVSQTVPPGATVVVTVVAQGTPPILYRWQRLDGGELNDNGRITGSRTDTLTIQNVSEADEAQYSVLAIGPNIVESSPAMLTVIDPPVIQQVLVAPLTGVAPIGGSVSFTVVLAQGDPPFTYQWKRNGVDLADNKGTIAGAQAASMSIGALQPADAGDYTVSVTNAAGEDLSSPTALSVGLTLIVDLADKTVEAGDPFQWKIVVGGTLGSVNMQWKKENPGTGIFEPLIDMPQLSGVNTDTLLFNPVELGDQGHYMVEVTDDFSTVSTRIAYLRVVESLPALNGAGLAALVAALIAVALCLRRRRTE